MKCIPECELCIRVGNSVLNHFHDLGFILLPLLSSSSLQNLNMLSIQGLEKGIINAINSAINSSSVRTATKELC